MDFQQQRVRRQTPASTEWQQDGINRGIDPVPLFPASCITSVKLRINVQTARKLRLPSAYNVAFQGLANICETNSSG